MSHLPARDGHCDVLAGSGTPPGDKMSVNLFRAHVQPFFVDWMERTGRFLGSALVFDHPSFFRNFDLSVSVYADDSLRTTLLPDAQISSAVGFVELAGDLLAQSFAPSIVLNRAKEEHIFSLTGIGARQT